MNKETFVAWCQQSRISEEEILSLVEIEFGELDDFTDEDFEIFVEWIEDNFGEIKPLSLH
jgi:hypothetical protein